MADPEVHARYAAALMTEERMLVLLREDLYGGSWDRMVADLNERLAGRPYIFKVVHRIEEDLSRIEKLRSYEDKHGINLREFILRDPASPPYSDSPDA